MKEYYVNSFIDKFNMHTDFSEDPKKAFLDHINIYIKEEYEELLEATNNNDVEEIIDALGDLSWLIDKAMIIVDVDPNFVRSAIGRANLSKEIGVKPGRENASHDVIKPTGWVGPDHRGNHGKLEDILAS